MIYLFGSSIVPESCMSFHVQRSGCIIVSIHVSLQLSWLPNLALPITDIQYQWGIESEYDVNGAKKQIYVTVDLASSTLSSCGLHIDSVY